MLRNNADVRRCSYFELGLPVLTADRERKGKLVPALLRITAKPERV